jgi:hypothetical protein
VALQRTPLGFDPHGLVAFDVILGPGSHRTTQAETRAMRIAIAEHIMDALRATPGVTSAAFGPMPGQPWRTFGSTLTTGGEGSGAPARVSYFGLMPVTLGYFAVARMPLLAGREPAMPPASSQPLAPGAPPGEVAIDRALAERLWPGRSPLGQ